MIFRKKIVEKKHRNRLLIKQIYKIFYKILRTIDSERNYYFISPTSDWFYDDKNTVKNINNVFAASRQKNLKEVLKLTIGLSGDYYEFGVYKGASAEIICNFLKNNYIESVFYGFDSFEGLSQPLEIDGSHWNKHDLKAGILDVHNKLNKFENYKLIEGWLPESIEQVEIGNIAFAHFDLDLFQPTYDTLKVIYKKVVKGGILLFDDYGLTTCPGVTSAVNKFFDKNKIINLASGGTFVIKDE